MSVAADILAAGRYSRFKDGHKLLVEIDGVAMVRRVARAIAESNVGDIVLVAAEADGAIAQAAGTGRWRTIANPDAQLGLSTSLRRGLESIDAASDGVMVALADMPGLTTDLVNRLLAAFAECGRRAIVFPVAADGRRGHPVIWPRMLFPALEAVTADVGGKAIIAEHRELWRPVVCNDAGAFVDIDTHDDLATFRGLDPQPTRRK